jgi:hypothetical protein
MLLPKVAATSNQSKMHVLAKLTRQKFKITLMHYAQTRSKENGLTAIELQVRPGRAHR